MFLRDITSHYDLLKQCCLEVFNSTSVHHDRGYFIVIAVRHFDILKGIEYLLYNQIKGKTASRLETIKKTHIANNSTSNLPSIIS